MVFRYIPRSILHTLQWIGKEDSPFIKGVMAPVPYEIFTENLEVVEGTLPKELSGAYMRTGPNPQHKPWGGYHWCVLPESMVMFAFKLVSSHGRVGNLLKRRERGYTRVPRSRAAL